VGYVSMDLFGASEERVDRVEYQVEGLINEHRRLERRTRRQGLDIVLLFFLLTILVWAPEIRNLINRLRR